MKVITTRHHTISVAFDRPHQFHSDPCRCIARKAFEFHSEDIGCTQGTTISYRGRVLVQYKPGTRHWGSALETAERLIRNAVQAAVDHDGHFWFHEVSIRLVEQIQADSHCLPWDGTVPEATDELNIPAAPSV